MNKQRRQSIEIEITGLERIKSKLEDILAEEEYTFENMPENLQGSLRGEKSEESIDILTEAIDSLDSIIDSLKEI